MTTRSCGNEKKSLEHSRHDPENHRKEEVCKDVLDVLFGILLVEQYNPHNDTNPQRFEEIHRSEDARFVLLECSVK